MTVPHKGKIAFGYAVLNEHDTPEAEALIVALSDLGIAGSKIATALTEAVGRFHQDYRISARAINSLRQEMLALNITPEEYFDRTCKDGNVA